MIERLKDISKERQLKLLEDEIAHSFERGQAHWMKVAEDLWEIRDKKLYPQQKFGQYSYQRWEIKERQALRLCRIWELYKEHKNCRVRQLLLEGGNKASIRATEAALALPEEQQEEVLEEAKKSGPPTEKSVKKAAAKKAPKTERPKDKTGYPIPERAMAIWNRRNELNEKLQPLYELEKWADNMQGHSDIFFRVHGFDFSKLLHEVQDLIFHIKQVIPEVVCTQCHGVDEACKFCYGRGMIPMSLAKVATPIEMKGMRDKLTPNDSIEKLSSSSR